MSFRTVVVSSKCKLSYKGGYLVYRGDDVKTIHLSEINTLIIDSTAVNITTYLICELNKNKIKIIFCDENSNPISEVVPYYGSHNTSKRVDEQINWNKLVTEKVWTSIIKNKMKNQLKLLKQFQLVNCDIIEKYIGEVELGDKTNREGLSAKVYFRSMFGEEFARDVQNDVNAALNYGYTILLSSFNKEIVSKGYITQLGIKHKNQFNYFNLSSDLMEPFRCLVDKVVYENITKNFDHDYKMLLVDILNKQVKFDGKEQFVSTAIHQYLNSVFNAINKEDETLLIFGELI